TVKVLPLIPVKFVDVTKEAGIVSTVAPDVAGNTISPLSPGACLLDYDNDGKDDIFLPSNGADGGMSLYHNLGNGKFADVTKQAIGLDPTSRAVSCTAGDYDNDGFADLAVGYSGGVLLYHNEKNGKFKDVTVAAGITHYGLNPSLTFIDYDHDGDLDLYVTEAPATDKVELRS